MALLERTVYPDGTVFETHGPPYTQEEEDAFYARYAKGMMSGQATVLHPDIKGGKPPHRPPQFRSCTSSCWETEPPYRRNLGIWK